MTASAALANASTQTSSISSVFSSGLNKGKDALSFAKKKIVELGAYLYHNLKGAWNVSSQHISAFASKHPTVVSFAGGALTALAVVSLFNYFFPAAATAESK